MNDLIKMLSNISNQIKGLENSIEGLRKKPPQLFKEQWIDGQDVMLALNISKSTLQTLRDANVLPYSRINGKFYYKVSDLENLLANNYSLRYGKGGEND